MEYLYDIYPEQTEIYTDIIYPEECVHISTNLSCLEDYLLMNNPKYLDTIIK